MPILNRAIQIAAKPLPKTISPKTHAILDYMTAGAFIMSAFWFWSRSKRAAIAALISGAAELAVSMLTNYPGGVRKVIDFGLHRDIDFGLAAMTAMMPEFLAFKDESERKFFLAEGAIITAVSQLTRFPDKRVRAERKFAA
jgi:membrane-bound metal-dependent hydrolase YbcI (DUF457 family)